MCEAYDKWIKRRSSELVDDTEIYYIEYQFYQSLIESIAEMFIYPLSIYGLLYFFDVVKQAKWMEKKIFLTFVNLTLSGFYGNFIHLIFF